jgi:hypothetical protein
MRLYSRAAVGVATFFGGPLAAGLLLRRNFLSMGRKQAAHNSLILGIVATVALFGGLFMLPENVVDKIPNALLPALYTCVILGIMEGWQGTAIKKHKATGGVFYSGWRAAGVSFLCLTGIAAGMAAYIFMSPDDADYDARRYDSLCAAFESNQGKALKLEDYLTDTPDRALWYIDSVAISMWRRNVELTDSLDMIENLPLELKRQNELLREYATLRLGETELLRKAVAESGDEYGYRLDLLRRRIDRVLAELNAP